MIKYILIGYLINTILNVFRNDTNETLSNLTESIEELDSIPLLIVALLITIPLILLKYWLLGYSLTLLLSLV